MTSTTLSNLPTDTVTVCHHETVCHPESVCHSDDYVFKKCMVRSQPCNFAFGDPKEQEESINPHLSVPYTMPITPSTMVSVPYTMPVCVPNDPSRPAMQPGAGIYTSPLTVNVEQPLKYVSDTIENVLRVLQMPSTLEAGKFKYKVAVYFSSSFARFSVRIWSRSKTEGSYAVEVMRERGDRILVTRLFEMLLAALANPAEIANFERDFSVAMFDWAPRKLSADILAKLPKPSTEAVASGIAGMISMVTSFYDDVAVNGCASVGKLAANSESARDSMAGSLELVYALVNIVTLTNKSSIESLRQPSGYEMSLDTRSNAAMALFELTHSGLAVSLVSLDDFQQLLTTLHSTLLESRRFPSVGSDNLMALVAMDTKAWETDIIEWNSVKSHERYYLVRYCAESLREFCKNPEFAAKFSEFAAKFSEFAISSM
jgi:hypothetical protein